MEHAAAAPHREYSFGPFTLFPERQLLLSGTTALRIGGRALDILTALVERPGELLTKRELMARAWPTTVVDDSNLKVNMAGLRRVLGEGGEEPRYIATIVGRGYRFVAEVQSPKPPEPPGRTDPGGHGHNLPAATRRIVGRESAVAGLQRDINEARLVSLVGPGGVGKTTVALAAAYRKLVDFKGGVWLVDLASLKDPALMPDAIAIAVGMAAHTANVLAALCSFLRDRELLLLLDSCEHLVDAAAACAMRLLNETSKLRILVTSREPLGLPGERVRRLPGLGAPPVATSADSLQALAFPAVELFVERAIDRLGSFTLRDADVPVVAEICRRLDGLALAIELAAARVDAFGVGEILSLLNARFRLLKGRRSGPDRHQTLSAAIDWSFDLLSRVEQIILCRLSVFAGAFDLESALNVVVDDGLPPSEVTEGIVNLIAKSLLAAAPGHGDLEYRLLDTTRGYAMEKLDAQPDQEGVRRRHAQHALEVTQHAGAEGSRLEREEWIERFGDRVDDIRLALDWALSPRGSAALAIRLTVAAVPFWERLSRLEECRRFVERAMACSDATDLSPDDEMVLCLASGGAQLFTHGLMPEVRQLFVRALVLAEQLGRADLRRECLKRVSEYQLWADDSESSLQVSAAVHALESAESDLSALANADVLAGSALHHPGELHHGVYRSFGEADMRRA